MTPLATAAVAYARAGIAVFPIKPRDKIPYGRTVGLHMATADPVVAKARWEGLSHLPLKTLAELRAADRKAGRNSSDAELLKPVFAGGFANIGMATGKISGFFVFDIDGPDGAASLAALEARHGALPPTPEQSTGKGRHFCFAWPSAEFFATGRKLKNSVGKIGDGLDIRGDGGYIVAAPSIHPSGRAYVWVEGRGPGDMGFAPAPDWLLDLVAPMPKPAAAPAQPRKAIAGRATAYGEAALTSACRAIATAPDGRKNDTLFLQAIGIGQLVAGGEIADSSYAVDALREAGRSMCHWTPREEDTLERGFTIGMDEPRQPTAKRELNPVGEPPRSQRGDHRAGGSKSVTNIVQTPAQEAQRALDGAGFWASARPARCAPVLDWFRAMGLDPDGAPGALDRFRVHAAVPDTTGVRRPHLLIPMTARPGDPVETLALFDIAARGYRASRPAGFIGPQVRQRALLLSDFTPGEGGIGAPVVVGMDFADTWVLATLAAKGGRAIRAVAALTVTNFCGGVLGDKYGRVDPALPQSDAGRPPWLLPADLLGAGRVEVGLILRRDMKTHPLQVRAATGGTVRRKLTGEAASAFFGSLAVQAWSRLTPKTGGSLELRLLMPPEAASFHEQMTRGDT